MNQCILLNKYTVYLSFQPAVEWRPSCLFQNLLLCNTFGKSKPQCERGSCRPSPVLSLVSVLSLLLSFCYPGFSGCLASVYMACPVNCLYPIVIISVSLCRGSYSYSSLYSQHWPECKGSLYPVYAWTDA